MEGYTRVASLADLPAGQLLGIEVEGHRICLVNCDDEIYALQDNCSHKDFPLSAGTLEDCRLECAWHGAKFDVQSGRAISLPAIKPVRTYKVRIDGGDILLQL
jgi:3-phenylpropionate/trans-cinnamate dioxygenase ferredoxin subunit